MSRIINLPGCRFNGKNADELTNYDWKSILNCFILSEDFIREFQDKVNWEYVSAYQTLSESFIREFQDR